MYGGNAKLQPNDTFKITSNFGKESLVACSEQK